MIVISTLWRNLKYLPEDAAPLDEVYHFT